MYIKFKNIIYVKHSEAHTQLSHLMKLDDLFAVDVNCLIICKV